MRNRWTGVIVTALVLCALAGQAIPGLTEGGKPDAKPPAEQKPERDSGLRVDAKARRVEIDATVLEPNQVLEYLLVVQGDGPEYESLLSARCTVRELHMAMLMIGLTPDSSDTEFARGALGEVHGEKVDIWVEWPVGEGVVRKRVEELLKRPGKPVPAEGWTFIPFLTAAEAASRKHGAQGRFRQETSGSLISIIHDPFSVLTQPRAQHLNPDPMITPGPAAPKPGTRVKLIFEAVKEAELVKRDLALPGADKKFLTRLLTWANRLDRHRARRSEVEREIYRLSKTYKALKAAKEKAADKTTVEDPYPYFLKVERTKRTLYAARAGVLRDQQEITALRMGRTIEEEAAKTDPNKAFVKILKDRNSAIRERLAFLRLLDRRESANGELARLAAKLDQLQTAGKHEEAQKVRAKRQKLSADAEVLDIRIQKVKNTIRIKQARARVEELKREIKFLENANQTADAELKKLGADIHPPPKKE